MSNELTDEQIDLIANDGCRNAAGGIYATRVYEFARAIEQAARAALSDAAQAPEPDCWAILTPNGSRLVSPEEAKGRRDAYPLYAAPIAADAAAPTCTRCQPYRDATGELVLPLCRCKQAVQPDESAAFDLPPLPAPLEIDWPELHSHALGCGVEDRNILDRYEAAEYGWLDGADKAAERVPEEIFTADQMREYALAAVARATAPQAQPDERAAPTDSIPLHEDMLRALEHVECVYRQNVVKDGEPSSTLANLQRVIARARATAPQATMPLLTDAMRAVLRNENCIYGSEDDLYTALCAAADVEQRTNDDAISFIKDISTQKPEKPDYWSACGQCEHNIERAQEILESQGGT